MRCMITRGVTRCDVAFDVCTKWHILNFFFFFFLLFQIIVTYNFGQVVPRPIQTTVYSHLTFHNARIRVRVFGYKIGYNIE
jgi:hypothetical protein